MLILTGIGTIIYIIITIITIYIIIIISATTIGLLIKTNFDIPKYTNTSILPFTIIGIQMNAMSFVLFWTLAYAIVNIY